MSSSVRKSSASQFGGGESILSALMQADIVRSEEGESEILAMASWIVIVVDGVMVVGDDCRERRGR